MKQKTIICTVTTDLSFDQRMMRICNSLSKEYNVILVGRKKRKSKPLRNEKYTQQRIKCFFEKGKLFYFEYNLRLFFFLLFSKYDCCSSIDLDTILPGYIVCRLRGKKQTYDAHEYFTEMEEIVRRPLIKKVWTFIEKITVPNIKNGYTVSAGYANLFKQKYGVDYKIVRNATVLENNQIKKNEDKYILYQGAVNEGRGLLELIEAMKNIEMKLIICGEGDYFDLLVEKVKQENLTNKIIFKGYVEPAMLKSYTYNAYIGITIFSNKGLSNQFSLANRFFDYFHSNVPQLAMKYQEYIDFNNEFEVAYLLESVKPNEIYEGLNKLISDKNYYNKLKSNCEKAKQKYNWQNEEKTLLDVYKNVFSS